MFCVFFIANVIHINPLSKDEVYLYNLLNKLSIKFIENFVTVSGTIVGAGSDQKQFN